MFIEYVIISRLSSPDYIGFFYFCTDGNWRSISSDQYYDVHRYISKFPKKGEAKFKIKSMMVTDDLWKTTVILSLNALYKEWPFLIINPVMNG